MQQFWLVDFGVRFLFWFGVFLWLNVHCLSIVKMSVTVTVCISFTGENRLLVFVNSTSDFVENDKLLFRSA